MPLKIIDRTPFAKDGKFDFMTRIQANSKFGSDWTSEAEAHQDIVNRLQKTLNDRFTLLQNFTLPDIDYPIPFILIGPTGVRVIYVSPATGLFQAEGDEWKAFDKRAQIYKPTTPNLLRRTLLFSKAVESFIRRNGKEAPFLEPVIIFSDPGVDVETNESLVRVVRLDALARFIPSLNAGSATLTTADTDSLIKFFTKSTQSTQPENAQKQPINISLSGGFLKKFTRNQIIILIALVAIAILTFGTLAMFIIADLT